MIQGFKDFISRGNAIDLAVGVVIGAAFGEVITALVEDFLNPLIGALFGKPDFNSLFEFQIHLLGDPAVVRPGVFLTALLNFLIVAAASLLLRRRANQRDEQEEGRDARPRKDRR